MYQAFDSVRLTVGWTFFFAGLLAIPLTFIDFLPPQGGDWRADIIACIGWLLVIAQGFDMLHDQMEDDFDDND